MHHPTAIIDGEVSSMVGPYCVIEAGTVIEKDCVIQGQVRIGKYCLIEEGCVIKWGAILTQKCHLKKNVFIGPQTILLGGLSDRSEKHGIIIEEGVYIGAGVRIAAGVKICSGVVVGVNSFVNKDITEAGTYVGTPCRKL
jgi:acetyltransferase-like isoleucine patch superfamily enzyme